MDINTEKTENNYTKIEVDLNKCNIITLFELWLYSKRRNKIRKPSKNEKLYLCICESLREMEKNLYEKSRNKKR